MAFSFKLSRQARIITLLIIDVIFFFIEISVGYAVKSLALVADSFHMLNDVLSLLVALYAIKLATSPSNANNSYGWQRAEILGALINGVFLLALCFSIFLDAIERFVNITEVSNPKLVIIVGSLGLASNIVGLFLFHEHGHSHGHSHDAHESPSVPEIAIDDSASSSALVPSKPPLARIHSRRRNESQSGPSGRRERADSIGSLYGHPAQTRAAVIEAAQEFGYGRHNQQASTSGTIAFSPRDESVLGHSPSQSFSNAHSHHLQSQPASTTTSNGKSNSRSPSADRRQLSAENITKTNYEEQSNSHHDHDHAHNLGEAEAGGHSHTAGDAGHSDGGGHGHGGHDHSHGSMNMKGVFLHVLGDALGNVGVISAGLVILLAKGNWRYYFDPAISLLITIIIFHSALPLVKSASYILMQGVPGHISLEAVRNSISNVDGVVSLHELHVWQLSETTVVASVHVLVSRSHEYMAVAEAIRKALHEHGVHSSTIQPEFGDDAVSRATSETACLIRCPPDMCGSEITCCPPVGELVDVNGHERADLNAAQNQQPAGGQ